MLWKLFAQAPVLKRERLLPARHGRACVALSQGNLEPGFGLCVCQEAKSVICMQTNHPQAAIASNYLVGAISCCAAKQT